MRSTALRIAAVTTSAALAAGCASTTLIKSVPPGAKVYVDGEPAGTTPYPMRDQKIVGSSTQVKLVLDGYEPFQAVIQRNEVFNPGACIGGVLVLFPFLWIMDYKPEHTYELTPLRGAVPPGQAPYPAQPAYPPQAAPYPPQAVPAPQPPPAAAPQQPPPSPPPASPQR